MNVDCIDHNCDIRREFSHAKVLDKLREFEDSSIRNLRGRVFEIPFVVVKKL